MTTQPKKYHVFGGTHGNVGDCVPAGAAYKGAFESIESAGFASLQGDDLMVENSETGQLEYYATLDRIDSFLEDKDIFNVYGWRIFGTGELIECYQTHEHYPDGYRLTY